MCFDGGLTSLLLGGSIAAAVGDLSGAAVCRTVPGVAGPCCNSELPLTEELEVLEAWKARLPGLMCCWLLGLEAAGEIIAGRVFSLLWRIVLLLVVVRETPEDTGLEPAPEPPNTGLVWSAF